MLHSYIQKLIISLCLLFDSSLNTPVSALKNNEHAVLGV